MSVYQQPQSYYGAQSYPAPAFAAPSVYGSYYHQQPPVAPVYFMDPHSFRREYSARLADLTVNSRPIIQNLSMLAHEYSRYAEIVSECLQLHIQRVPPWMKLPAFYLLDMISKNIFDPYARHFASFVIPLFLDAYHAVDLPTRSKMEELLLTWRSGAPNRKELFGVAAQVAIERGVWGDGGSSSASASRGPTKTQVLSELEFALGQKERAVQSNPYDAASQQHVAVLQQLRRVVEAGVSQPELQQILNQLRTLVQPANPQAPPPQAPSWTAPPASFPSSSRSVYPPPEPVPMQAPTPNSVLAPSTSTPVPSAAPDFSALLSTLMKAGVVASKNGTPVDNSAHDTRDNIETESADVSLEHDAARAYMESILSHDVQLSTAGITRSTPAIAELLYAADSLQCRQCGLRYPNTPIGKKSRQEHLDMHFRQNRKVNENLGRGHSRSWFVAVEDWVNDTMDVKGKGRAGVRRLSATAVAAAERSKRDAELRALFVTVPPGDEAKLIACPICKETLKSEFIEDDEDWVWKNAVIKDGRVYHATCHAETSSNSLASRLLGQPRSRSGTPERFVKEGTPPSSGLKRQSPTPSPNSRVAGIKRKVEDTLSGSPPVKKFAIAAS